MAQTIQPFGDRVIAIKTAAQATTSSGIYIPEAAQEQPAYATVTAVGPDVSAIKVSDKIVYKQYAATEVKHAAVEYLIIKEEDILAKVEG